MTGGVIMIWQFGGEHLTGNFESQADRLEHLKGMASESVRVVGTYNLKADLLVGGILQANETKPALSSSTPSYAYNTLGGTAWFDNTNSFTTIDVVNNGLGDICIDEIIVNGYQREYLIMISDPKWSTTTPQGSFGPAGSTERPVLIINPTDGNSNYGDICKFNTSGTLNEEYNVIRHNILSKIVLLKDTESKNSGTGGAPNMFESYPPTPTITDEKCDDGEQVRIITQQGNVITGRCKNV